MNNDRFIFAKNNIPHTNPLEEKNNFFLKYDIVSMPITNAETTKHINDYDSNMLEEEAYKDVKDTIFQLEYKLAKTEEKLKDISAKLDSAKEIKDEIQISELTAQQYKLMQEYKDLTYAYQDISLSAKISGKIAKKAKTNTEDINNILVKINNAILSKLPTKFVNLINIKKSLSALENINKSVNELMKNKYTYGEASEKYTQLTKYIARANAIQAEISKCMK